MMCVGLSEVLYGGWVCVYRHVIILFLGMTLGDKSIWLDMIHMQTPVHAIFGASELEEEKKTATASIALLFPLLSIGLKRFRPSSVAFLSM